MNLCPQSIGGQEIGNAVWSGPSVSAYSITEYDRIYLFIVAKSQSYCVASMTDLDI